MYKQTATAEARLAVSASEIRYHRLKGLRAEEVDESRERFGSNRLTEKKKDGFLRQFLKNFNDPIIRILLGALAVNMAVTFGHINWYENAGIAAAVLIAALVSTVSEYSSEAAFETMRAHTDDIPVSVRREGKRQDIPASELVAGDILFLTAGSFVPADGIVLEGELTVDQSSLSGESEEKKKTANRMTCVRESGRFPENATDWQPDSAEQVFRGSRVCSGEAEILILRVGDATLYGSTASGLQEETRPSPLKERLSVLAKSVSFLGYVAAGVIAFAYLFNVFVIDQHMNGTEIWKSITTPSYCFPHLIRALTIAISILVVAVPEGLPMMITVVLSSNMKKMMQAGVLVRRLVGIETAGSVNILFTDKTGTLTLGKMRVDTVVTGEESYTSLSALQRSSAIALALWENHCACDAIGRGNATDQAMRKFWGKESETKSVKDRLPFDSSRRYASGATEQNGKRRLWIRGAPETILARSTQYLGTDGRTYAMTPGIRARMQRTWNAMAEKSCRVIAAAEVMPGDGAAETETWILIALIGIRDRLRSDAVQAVADARRAGIQTVMITGDNGITAGAIARECGILREDSDVLLTGDQLHTMDDAEISAILPRLAVVARALPTDKSRLVQIAQQNGLVVGMTGDGMNDAAALKMADVGFAMGSGTDVAREAGSIVITDDRFSSIMRAVLFGRTVFLSIRKFIVFQLTMNLCAVGISLIGPFIGIETPVTVIQMLWVNIIMDTLGALAFAGEPALQAYLRRPPIPRDEKLLNVSMIRNILTTGLYSLLLCIWFLKSSWMHQLFARGDDVYYLTVFFAIFIFCGVFNSFLARSDDGKIFSHLSRNKPFLLIMSAVAVIQLMIVYFGGEVFRCEALTIREILWAALLSFSVIPMNLLLRMIFRNIGKIKKDTR